MKYKILVADDSPAYLKIVEQIFKFVGEDYSLIFAENGKEACEKAEKEIPDLILMDVIMPELNGIQALKILKQNPKTEKIPIIVLSASESLKSAFEAGATDFITKPFKHYELLLRVRSALNLVEKLQEIKSHIHELEKQKLLVELSNRDIISDIRYSLKIQKAIFPTQEYVFKLFPGTFILNMPKNIVSGDFYWFGEKKNDKIVVVADCTGHGISGAFMTIAGISFLNEIINKYEYKYPHDILNMLREKVMDLLKQKGLEGETTDGMDISLCIINKEKKTLQFTGAFNPIYIINDHKLEVIKADRMPIGIHENYTRSFTTTTFTLSECESIYLFSDGFADQFGGPSNKKFRFNNFQELILKNSDQHPDIQREILKKTLIDWKGNEEQIDDILIVGIKLKV